MKKSLLLALCLIVIVSCSKTEGPQSVLVDIENQKIPDIEIINTLPLQTSNECLIADISSIQLYNDCFFILDSDNAKTLFLFDSLGNLVNKTKYGRGPSEMLYPVDFCIDSLAKMVMIWDQDTHKMKKYDLRLNCMSDTTIEMVVDYFTELPSGNWLVNVNGKDYYNKGGETDNSFYHYFIYSPDFSKIEYKHFQIANKDFSSVSLPSAILKTKNPMFCKLFDLNIYGLDLNEQVISRYQVNFGKFNPPKNFTNKPMDEIFAEQNRGDYVASIGEIVANDNFLCFCFPLNCQYEYAIYSKQLNRSFTSIAIVNSGILPRGRVMATTSDGSLVLVADAADYVAFCEAKGQPTAVKPTDNPVLVIFTIDEP